MLAVRDFLLRFWLLIFLVLGFVGGRLWVGWRTGSGEKRAVAGEKLLPGGRGTDRGKVAESARKIGSDCGNWGIFRGDRALSGVAEDARLPDRPQLYWHADFSSPVCGAPVIGGGLVFVGSCDGMVRALYTRNGKTRWSVRVGAELTASPLYFGGRVFIGTAEGRALAFDGASGKILWRQELGGQIFGSANAFHDAAGDWVIFSSFQGVVVCLNAVSGKERWRYTKSGPVNGTVAITAGTGVFGSCDGRLYFLRLADGILIRSVVAGSYLGGSPAIADGRVWAGAFGRGLLEVDLSSGKLLQRFLGQEGDTFMACPALGKDRIVVAITSEGVVSALRPGVDAMQVVWRFSVGGATRAAPVICGNSVVQGGGDGRLYVLSLRDGRVIWRYDLGGEISGSPAIGQHLLVTAAGAAGVYAFVLASP